MKMENGRFSLYGNEISASQSRSTEKWQRKFVKMFGYDPNEKYELRLVDNPEIGPILGVRNLVRGTEGDPVDPSGKVVISTVRMGFGHYRIAMAGASCARAMGFTPLWLDLLSTPGITSDVIGWCNDSYSRMSRLSQRSEFFNRHVWEAATTGNRTLPGLDWVMNHWVEWWPWRFVKTNVKDYKMSELFRTLHQALPSDMPILTSHMWCAMGAVAGGMTNVVDMVFDNWPMAFQLTEGARHGIQSPSGYYGFRTMRGFDESGKVMKPVPPDALAYTGHHVDHEIVENIEVDCAARIRRMNDNEPRRLLLTLGGAGAQREVFKAIIEHSLPLIQQDKVALFVNLGDHKGNWDWLQAEMAGHKDLIHTHFSWDDTMAFADEIRTKPAHGLHVFLHDNIFHAVYSTNYLMRVVDVMITKPSELAFYPVPKIFNKRVGGHEAWGAIRGAELGDGTVEANTTPHTLQAIDLLSGDRDLMEMYCDSIVKNKSIGVYDGAYKCVEMATGRKFERSKLV
jgi:hypothetical protein